MRLLLAIALLTAAQLPAPPNSAWSQPYPAHKIEGNLYYVGTADLACFLIATPQGHILINTGLKESVPTMRSSIESLRFKLSDIKILLHMQAHYDHVAAMAELQKLSKAKIYSTEADTPILESGGKADSYIGREYLFAPVHVDRKLRDGDTIQLGGTTVKVILTPGHTPGSVSYMVNGTGKPVLAANIGTVVMPLVNNKLDPKIVEHYEQTFRVQKAFHPDIWVAAHASQYNMDAKRKAGSFVDPAGYQQAVANAEKNFRRELSEQSQSR